VDDSRKLLTEAEASKRIGIPEDRLAILRRDNPSKAPLFVQHQEGGMVHYYQDKVDAYRAKISTESNVEVTDQTRSEACKTNSQSQIYAIGYKNNSKYSDYIKLGRSKTPSDRLNSLQTGSPFELQIRYTCSGGAIAESYCHTVLDSLGKSKGLKGEWFCPPSFIDIPKLMEKASQIEKLSKERDKRMSKVDALRLCHSVRNSGLLSE